MERLIQEFKESNVVGVPMRCIDEEFMEDDTYTCVHLYRDGEWSYDAVKHYPETRRFIKEGFGDAFRQAFFSTMRGPKFMAPHRNENRSSTLMRYHLGVVVDKKCDGVLKVGERQHRWEVRKGFVFDPKEMHSVYKTSDYERTVLIVDYEPDKIQAIPRNYF